MNKFNLYITVFAMVLVVSCSYGQVSNGSKSKTFRAAKLYVNSNINGSTTVSSQKINLLNEFSPSFSWGKSYKNFHEVSVKDLGLMYASGNRKFSSTIAYSYNTSVLKLKPESRFDFYIGAGVSAGYAYSRNNSFFGEGFSANTSGIKVDLNVIPRVTYKINERTFVDLNIPYSVYSSSKRWSAYSGSIESHNQKSVQVNNRAFPNQFTVSVGVAIKF